MLATWHFHIEISSKCTLRCPRCARQEVPDSLVNTELDLEFFKTNFTPEVILSNVVDDAFWDSQFKTFKWQECQTKCAATRVDEKYATEW